MKKRNLIVVLVIVAVTLVATNLWWFFQELDQASREKYHEQMLYERLEAMKAAHRAIPTLTAHLSREEVIADIQSSLQADPSETFEKEGWVVVGWIHLQFDQAGRLVKVGPDFQ